MASLAPYIIDAITGHGRKTVADTYGEFESVDAARIGENSAH
jgi:hypothetical protein